MELEQLIQRFQQKESSAFEKLYTMYSKSIHGIIFNIVRNEEIAQELLQDTFIKAWHNADSYSPKKGQFFTWILNIARNAAIDKIRSKSFKNNKQNLNADFFVDVIASNDNLDKQTNAIGIRKFVSKLANTCKQLIELLYFKGFTQKEASETLDMPIGTIKTRNRNCILQLRELLEV